MGPKPLKEIKLENILKMWLTTNGTVEPTKASLTEFAANNGFIIKVSEAKLKKQFTNSKNIFRLAQGQVSPPPPPPPTRSQQVSPTALVEVSLKEVLDSLDTKLAEYDKVPSFISLNDLKDHVREMNESNPIGQQIKIKETDEQIKRDCYSASKWTKQLRNTNKHLG